MSRARSKGTWAESAVVEYASHSGFPFADRLTLKGNKDRGDVGLCPGVIAEVKNCKTFDFPGWLRETEDERVNAKAQVGFLIVKPPGIGKTRVGWWWSVMYAGQWLDLRASAGSPTFVRCQYNQTPHLPDEECSMVTPVWHLPTISGASYRKALPPLLKALETAGVVIRANGVKNERDWYVVTRLEQQFELLRAAGYGSREVLV